MQTTLRQKGPGYWNTGPQNAFENKESQLPCRSPLISDLAPFFIELRAERSSVSGCGFLFLMRVQRKAEANHGLVRELLCPCSLECCQTPRSSKRSARTQHTPTHASLNYRRRENELALLHHRCPCSRHRAHSVRPLVLNATALVTTHRTSPKTRAFAQLSMH